MLHFDYLLKLLPNSNRVKTAIIKTKLLHPGSVQQLFSFYTQKLLPHVVYFTDRRFFPGKKYRFPMRQ